jgi:hypothetical protein
MLKTIAILLNIILLGLLFYEIKQVGIFQADDMFYIFIFFAVPIINLCALIFGKDNLINLYFQRKALEEKKKISEIEKQ